MRKFVFILMAMFFVLFAGVFSFAGAEEEQKEVYYQAVTVYAGDTVWSIAKHYCPEQTSTKEYVQQIMEFNKMKGEFIRSGQQLLLPRYVEA